MAVNRRNGEKYYPKYDQDQQENDGELQKLPWEGVLWKGATERLSKIENKLIQSSTKKLF